MKPQNSHQRRRHCIKPGCPNDPLPGRRTCGRHGHRVTTRRSQLIHIDRRLTQRSDDEDSAAMTPAADYPTTTPYLGTVNLLTQADRLVAVVGLPTSRENMIAFLEDWLSLPGHTLALLESLTPAQLRPDPLLANAYCRAADALVKFDVAGGRA